MYLQQHMFKTSTKSSDVTYLLPLWRHASRLKDASCSFTHPAEKSLRAHVKLCGQLMKVEWFVIIKIIHMESPITITMHEIVWIFNSIRRRFKHNHNEPHRHRRWDRGWHALFVVTHATIWRRKLYLYTSAVKGNHYSFAPKIHTAMLFIDIYYT